MESRVNSKPEDSIGMNTHSDINPKFDGKMYESFFSILEGIA